jgi:hypothetical protein
MLHKYNLLTILAIILALGGAALAQAAEIRTANRSVAGDMLYPAWVTDVPAHYEFLPLVSNHDAQNQHPQQWEGQDWDTSAWNENWTPEIALRKFYKADIFKAQYINEKNVPVLELGPTFYKLSDLDQRRMLKLLADYNNIFSRGFNVISLHDWYTKEIVGTYTAKGMQLY